jgi:hypothetical protein
MARTTRAISARPWEEIYNGYGHNVLTRQGWTLTPKAASAPDETHASLVVNTQRVNGDYQLSVRMTPLAQLRTNSAPNPWETGWLIFGYQPNGSFKYLILKPNGYGVELGEFLGGTQQQFLSTSPIGAESFPIGQSYQVTLTVKQDRIHARVNGREVLNYTAGSADRVPTNGRFGWYTEDASVRFEHARVRVF